MFVTSKDGIITGYSQIGHGPGINIKHGGLVPHNTLRNNVLILNMEMWLEPLVQTFS